MPAKRRSRPLPELEMEVIKILWRLGSASVAEVKQTLEPRRPLAYTTVMTVLERLTRKRAVSRWKKGRGYRYQAVWTKEEIRELAMERVLADFFDGSMARLALYVEEHQGGASERRPAANGHAKPNGGVRPGLDAMDSSLL